MIAALLSCSPQRVQIAAPDLNDAQRIASGCALYSQHCAACHGTNLQGQPNWMSRLPSGRLPAPPHDDSGHTWHHPIDLLFAITKFGLVPPHAPDGYVSDMPAFGKLLSDSEIWSVLAYIRSRWSTEVRQRHNELEARIQQQRQPK